MSRRFFSQNNQYEYWYVRVFLWLFTFFNSISLAVYVLLRFGFSDFSMPLQEEFSNVMKVMGIATTFAATIFAVILLADSIEWMIKKIQGTRNETVK